MGRVAALLREAQEAGLEVTPDGDRLKVRGPRKAEFLAKQLLARKWEVLEHLQAGSIISMPLDEFKDGFYAVRVYSQTQGRDLWFVSHDRAAHDLGVEGLYFTGEELVELIRLSPSAQDIQVLMRVKEILRGRLIRNHA